jgi:hypothetical protein
MQGKGLRSKTILYRKRSGSGLQEIITLTEEKFYIKISFLNGNISQTTRQNIQKCSGWMKTTATTFLKR